MTSSLIIYITPHTNMSASAIIALAELSLKHGIDIADTPSFMGFAEYTALLIAAEVSTERDLRHLMKVLQCWCVHSQPSGTFELSIRVDSLDLLIEQIAPVEGYKAIAALFTDLVQSVRLLKESDLLQQVTHLVLPAGHPHAEVRAKIGNRLAYLIAPVTGVVSKASTTGKLRPIG